LRIVDLETKSYSRNPQSSSAATIRRLESRIEELTNQLSQVTKDHRRTSLSSKFSAQLMESERQREKLEGEVRLYEDKVNDMRLQMDVVVSILVGDFTSFQGTDVWMLLANQREQPTTSEAARGARGHRTQAEFFEVSDFDFETYERIAD